MLVGMNGRERCNILKVVSCYSMSWSLIGERREQCTTVCFRFVCLGEYGEPGSQEDLVGHSGGGSRTSVGQV